MCGKENQILKRDKVMIIRSRKIWTAGQFLPACVEIEGNRIRRILPYSAEGADMDFGDRRVVPGFLDIHTHGAYGYDTNDGTEEGLRYWMEHIVQEGVTSILPTTVTQMPDVLTKAVENVAAVVEKGYVGAQILGIHFEGPYLDMDKKGAQPPEAITRPSVEQFKEYQKAAKGWIRYITLSPEHDEDFALTRYCSANGVTVSMGHSSADYETAVMAAANGATSMTHVYNGMSQFGSRSPGLVGAAFRMRELYGEVIGDGRNSHLAALYAFFQAKGPNRGILITDSLRVKYAQPGGHYQLGGHDIEVGEDGLARLAGTDTIAGSTLQMNQGLRILVEEAGVPFETALNACTVNPAACLGVADHKGRICAGYDADIVVLEDDYRVHAVFCRGTQMYEKK